MMSLRVIGIYELRMISGNKNQCHLTPNKTAKCLQVCLSYGKF